MTSAHVAALEDEAPGRGPARQDAGKSTAARAGTTALTLGALGVVFGDIGTSPLYAMSAIFRVHGVRPNAAGVDGMISLVVWTIILVVMVKYVTFVMRADNRGEGGIMALVALVQRLRVKGRARKMALVLLGIFGVALFFGDGTITPAISVISSVEGLETSAPGLKSFVVPITLTLLTLLFAVQQFGTRAIGRLFGPAMVVWFAILAVSGLNKIIGNPVILKALSPSYGFAFFLDHPLIGFLALGAVVLVVTGAEALYADLGQFDRRSITRAWIFVVFPALIIVVRVLWKKPLWIVVPGAAAFIVMDLAFFTANLTKVVTGGWFPLAVALIIFTLLSTWQCGRKLVTAKRSEAEGLLRGFGEEIR